MHENAKLAEAEYFLKEMVEAENDPSAFPFLLSAFLSAARSVLQYAHEEVKGNPPAQQWYSARVAGSQILRFFRERRDINVHQEPVQTNLHAAIALQVQETLHISETLRIVLTREDGTTENHESTSAPPPSKQEESKSSTSSKYFFNDWSGPEGIVILSQSYMTELKKFVSEGIAKKYISG